MKSRRELAVLSVFGGTLALFLLLPFLALLHFAFANSKQALFAPALTHALGLSVFTASSALFLTVLFGTPLAYSLAQSRSRIASVIELICELPIMTPPAVCGLLLLFTFGRHGLVTESLGLPSLAFSTFSVIVAATFVSAPFYLQASLAAFRSIDSGLIEVGKAFGAGHFALFFRVYVPLARRGLLGGGAMAFSRALGEFGATLLFAGNLEGRTQTLPLAIYGALESDVSVAMMSALVLTLVGFGLLLILRSALGGTR